MGNAPSGTSTSAARGPRHRRPAANISGMVIARVEAFLLDFPLPHRRLFSTGGNDSRGASVVRIEDADGTVGWGETYPLPAGAAKLAALGALLLRRGASSAPANPALLWGGADGGGFATRAPPI